MCLASDAMSTSAPLLWPRRLARTKPIDEILQPMRGGDDAYFPLGPKCKTRLLGYFDKLRVQGLTPDRDTWNINIRGPRTHGMLGAISLLCPLKG